MIQLYVLFFSLGMEQASENRNESQEKSHEEGTIESEGRKTPVNDVDGIEDLLKLMEGQEMSKSYTVTGNN